MAGHFTSFSIGATVYFAESIETLDEVIDNALVMDDKKQGLVDKLGTVIGRLRPDLSGQPS